MKSLIRIFSNARPLTEVNSPKRSNSAGTGRSWRWSRWLSGTSLLLLQAVSVHAACTKVTNWNALTANVALSGTISVPANAAVGTVLGTFSSRGGATTSPIVTSCRSGTEYVYYDVTSKPMPLSSYGTSVYETGLQGVGVQIQTAGGTPYPSTYLINGVTLSGNGSEPFKLVFFKTGPMAAGVVPSSTMPLAKQSVQRKIDMFYMTASGQVTFSIPGCSVSIPNVPLGKHQKSEFRGVNTYTSTTDFNVTLNNCPQTVRLYYQLDPTTSYANQSQSVINLNGDAGSAKGIGVQLVNASTLAASPMGAQQLIGTGQLNYTLPFKARYYQTGATVSPGVANATMNLTLFYQ